MRSGRLLPGVVVRALSAEAGADGERDAGTTDGRNSPGKGRGGVAAVAKGPVVRAGLVLPLDGDGRVYGCIRVLPSSLLMMEDITSCIACVYGGPVD